MNEPNYAGPSFCPNCGCNIRAVALALQFTAQPASPKLPMNGVHAVMPPARKTKTPPETAAEIVDRYNAGETASHLAREYDVSRAAVGSMIQRARRGRKPESKNLIGAKGPDILKLHQEGKTNSEICGLLDLKAHSVSGYLGSMRRLGRLPTQPL